MPTFLIKFKQFITSNKGKFLFGSLLVFLFLLPETSYAQVFLDKTAISFKDGATKWQATMFGYATVLFWKLMLIDFTWTTLVWVKDRKEIGEIWMGYVGKIFTFGFFWLLLSNAGNPAACSATQVIDCSWVATIIDSFTQIGKSIASASGADVGTLDSLLALGFKIALQMFDVLYSKASVTDVLLHPIDVAERTFMIIPIFATAIIVSLGFALIAGQLLIAMIESYIAIYGGIIMLGFGGSRWTSDMASSYLKFAVGAGLKLMLCYLVIGLGFNVFTSMIPPNLELEKIWEYVLTIIPITLIFVYLVFNIPGLAASIMSGSPNMSLGGMMGAAITAGAAMTGAGAAATALGGGGAAGAAKNALGDAAKGGLPGGGGGPGAAANAMNGGGGSGGVQPPGSGLGTTPSNMPGGPKSGPIATSLANDAAANESANTPQTGDSSGSSFVGPQAPTSAAPSSSIISTDTNIGNAKAAASSVPAAPAAKAGGGVAPTDSSSSVAPTAADSPSSVSSPSGDASGASVGTDHPHTALLTAISKNMAKMANGPEQVRTMSEKIEQIERSPI